MLVLLDLDGTLVDRDLAFRRWAVVLAHRYNADNVFVDWVLSEDRGGAWDRRELFTTIRERLGLEAPLDALTAEFMSEFTSHFECDPETTSALERARLAGHKLAIVTNGGPTQLDKIRRRTSLALTRSGSEASGSETAGHGRWKGSTPHSPPTLSPRPWTWY